MKKSLFIILAVALLNCGCSTISLVYRNADWYLQHKINGYTSFNARQKETIRKEVSNYMLWHHQQALPEYIIFLQNLNGVAQYNGQLRVAEVTRLRAHMMNLYEKSLVPAIRPAAQLLSGLDSRQIQKMGKTFSEEIQKQKQDELDISQDEILDKRADKTIDFLEWLIGNLSSEQEQKIRDMSRHLPVVNHIYIRLRETNQGKLITLLNNHADAEVIAAFLSTWLFTPELTRTAQQQRVIQSFELATDEMVAQIHDLMTARQKDHLHKMIISYIEEMRSFATATHAANGTSRQDLVHFD